MQTGIPRPCRLQGRGLEPRTCWCWEPGSGGPHLGCREGSWAGLVSSTSFWSLCTSLRRSATCTWSFRRSTASMAASLRTALMKASKESSVEEPEVSGERERAGGGGWSGVSREVGVTNKQIPCPALGGALDYVYCIEYY